MAASPSASPPFCSSSARCSSPGVNAINSNMLRDGGPRDGSPDDVLFSPIMSCDFIRVPLDYRTPFTYLHDTQLFFFDVLRKLNRKHTKDKRVCFITDYTINLAATDTGTVSRCSKVEDVAELICDRSRAVGIRMRARPFAIESQDNLRWSCFYEMPVDLLLFAESTEQFNNLIRVLRFVYRQCTKMEVACRVLEPSEKWKATLVLWPDGSRVKKKAMIYHRMPQSTEQYALLESPLLTATTTAQEEKLIEVPQSRGTRSAPAPGCAKSIGQPVLGTSPPPRPLSRHSFSPAIEDGKGLELEDFTTPPCTGVAAVAAAEATPSTSALPPPLMQHTQYPRSTVMESYSAVKRKTNPLAVGRNEDETGLQAPAGKPTCALPHSFLIDYVSGLEVDDATAQLYSPPTSPLPTEATRRTKSKVRALEAMMRDPQRCVRELRRSRYLGESELDDLKRHLNTTMSPHGPLVSYESPVRRKLIQLPKNHVSSGRKNEDAERERGRHRHSDKNGTRRTTTCRASSLNSSSLDHEAHLSTVKPIQSRGLHEKELHGITIGSDAAVVREAEMKLSDALRRHHKSEKSMRLYYKAQPTELQGKLNTYSHSHSNECDSAEQQLQDGEGKRGHSHRHCNHQRRSSEKELKYLRELMRQIKGMSVQPQHPRTGSTADIAEAVAVNGNQIEVFAQDLAHNQAEIDVLRRRLLEEIDKRRQ